VHTSGLNDSGNLRAIDVRAGRNPSAPTVEGARGLAVGVGDLLEVRQAARGVEVVCTAAEIAAVAAVFDDEGYEVTGGGTIRPRS